MYAALVSIWIALAIPVAGPAGVASTSGAFTGSAPVLTDPRSALQDARRLTDEGERLRAAEIELLAGDAKEAIRTLADFRPSGEGEAHRRVRLELDAYVVLGDAKVASERIERLAKRPEWQSHARKQRARLGSISTRGMLGQIGDVLFAGALAVLLLAAARELLRFRVETVIMLVAVVIAIALAGAAALPLGVPLGLVGLAMLALVHAAAGAVRRMAPGPKGRLFVLALAILGATGSAFAVLSRIDLSYLTLAFS